MKLFLFTLLIVFHVVLNKRICRALALGGGGDRGAYELGALQALIEHQAPEKTQYNVLTGISVGALNAGAFAQFKIGKEKEAIEFLTKTWMEMSFSKVASHWVPGSVVQGFLFKSGLFDTTPLDNFIKKNLNISALRESGRHLKVGATCLDTGNFEIWNETSKDIGRAVLASSAIPGVFPLVKINGKDYVDGGAVYLTPVSSALKKCEELGYDETEVDIILAIGDTNLPGWVDRLLSTPFILFRTIFATIANIFVKDIENAEHSFPHAKVRVIKPSKWLPGYFIGFGHTKKMIKIGYEDAMKVINKNK